MNPERVEEIRERWASPVTQMWPLGTQEARDVRDVQDLLAEIDELRALVEHLKAEARENRVVTCGVMTSHNSSRHRQAQGDRMNRRWVRITAWITAAAAWAALWYFLALWLSDAHILRRR